MCSTSLEAPGLAPAVDNEWREETGAGGERALGATGQLSKIFEDSISQYYRLAEIFRPDVKPYSL